MQVNYGPTLQDVKKRISYLQVCLGTQIPLAPYDGEAFGLHYYHPCTMPE